MPASTGGVESLALLPERIRRVTRRPADLGDVPPGAISLAMGEPCMPTPEPVVQAAVRALERGRTKYERLSGSVALREALARHLTDRTSVPVAMEQVVPTHGSSAGLAAAVSSLVRPGDRVLLPEPTYSLYADQVALVGGEVVWVPMHADGRLRLDLLEEQLATTRLVIVANPGNPTGRVIPAEDLHALARLVVQHQAYLLCDEAYSDIVFDGVEITSALELTEAADRVICCGTFSKSYAMTGWRLGFLVAPTEIAEGINLVHRTINGALNTFVQDAGVAALELPDEFFDELRAEYQVRRDQVMEVLEPVDFIEVAAPQGAFYAFPRIVGAPPSEEMRQHLASQAGVLVRSGQEYGPSGEQHLRISFATDAASLAEGLHRFVAGLRRLLRG